MIDVFPSRRARRSVSLTLFVGSTLLMLPAQGAGAAAGPSGSALPPVDALALAEQVRQAILGAAYLRVDEKVIHQGRVLLARAHMTPERLRTEAYRDNVLIGAFTFNDGRVQEYSPSIRPDDGVEYARCIAEYDAPDEDGVSVCYALMMDPDTGCEFGGLMVSWLDPAMGQADRWADKILEGERLEDQSVGGRNCLVYRTTLVLPPDEVRGELTITHTAYYDAETYLPLRWDTTQSTDAYAIERQRYYIIHKSDIVPADVQWTLDLKQIEVLAPPYAEGTFPLP